MSVKRVRLTVLHPGDQRAEYLAVEVAGVSIEFPIAPEDVGALNDLLQAHVRSLTPEGQAEFKAAVRIKTTKTLEAAERDVRLQDAKRKPRRPDVTAWITKAVKGRPTLTREELWVDAPEWITAQITIGSFKKRVSAVRKTITKK